MENRKLLYLCAALMILWMPGCGKSKRTEQPGEANFRAVNSSIIRDTGKQALGNTAQAEEMAALFAKSITVHRNKTIEKGSDRAFSLSNGKMLVYCQLTDARCAFLVHVPELRKFTGEAKQLMAEICWISAQAVLRSKGLQRDHLAVGVKGAMLYDAIIIGQTTDDPASERDGITEQAKGTDGVPKLYPFFAPEKALVEPANKG